MTTPQQPQPDRIPVTVKATLLHTPGQPTRMAITIATGNTQFTFVTDLDSAQLVPQLLAGVVTEVMPAARATAAGLVLPINGHRGKNHG